MRRTRKISRLPNFDYRSDGAYAITICTFNRKCVFGTIRDGVMHLNVYGRIALAEWQKTPDKRPYVTLDEFIIMPNHIHAILFFEGNISHETEHSGKREFAKPQIQSLGAVVGAYKSAVSKEIGLLRDEKTRTWQHKFWEHIIHHERDLENQRLYIVNNPSKWADDEINPLNPMPTWFETSNYPFPQFPA